MNPTTKTILLFSLSSTLLINTIAIGSAKSHKPVKPNVHTSQPAVTTTASSWVSNPAYSKWLAPEVKVDEFGVSPLAGYVLEQDQKTNGISIRDEFNWTGPKRSDGTMPKFRVAIYKALNGNPLYPTAEEAIQDGLAGLNLHSKHYIHTDIENGQVHELDFVRAYYKWDPNQPANDATNHGFQYLTLQGPMLITLLCYDDSRHYKSTLDIMEAAALTFHQ